MKENHNYNMIAQSLNDAISLLKEKLSDAKSSKAELTETEKSKAADETYVATLTQDCSATHLQWEERQASAKGEMAAIDKAKEILSEGVKVFVQFSDKKAKKLPADLDDDDEKEDKNTMVRNRL